MLAKTISIVLAAYPKTNPSVMARTKAPSLDLSSLQQRKKRLGYAIAKGLANYPIAMAPTKTLTSDFIINDPILFSKDIILNLIFMI